MPKTTSVEEHSTEIARTNNTAQFKRGAEIEDFWQPRMRVWSHRQLSGNKMLRMHGTVTGSLTRFIVPADSPKTFAIPTLLVRVRWDGLESDALLYPHELVLYTVLENTPDNSSLATNSEAKANLRRCQTQYPSQVE